MSALAKKDRGVRPVASGEVWRRIGEWARIHRQVGVATKDGATSLVNAVRRIVSQYELSETVVLKVYWANAFNCISRSAVIRAVAEFFPSLLRYASAAYGHGSVLVFGETTIASVRGVQQGDPLGPLLFSLALASVTNVLSAPFMGWYLDDGVLLLRRGEVASTLATLTDEGRKVGLTLNLAKCEIVSREGISHNLCVECKRTSLDKWSLLGIPLGTNLSVSSEKKRIVENVARKVSLFGKVALVDPHIGVVLLRNSGPLPLLQYHLQHWANDEHLHIARAAFPIDTAALQWEQVSLPVRLGGFGILPTADRAAIFTATSSARCESMIKFFIDEEVSPDPLTAAAVALTPRAPFDVRTHLEQELIGHAAVIRARDFTQKLDVARAALLVEKLPHRMKAILLSASDPGASLWVSTPGSCCKHLWLSSELFVVLARFRMGMHLCDADFVCPQCRQSTSDRLGDHALTCMSGGLRTLAHNAMRDQVSSLLSECLLRPIRETHPFTSSPAARIDISVFWQGKEHLIDVAITHPLREGGLHDASTSPGGAATTYEKVKISEYGRYVDATQQLVPLIFDTVGAVGESGRKFLAGIAAEYVKRYNSGTPGRLEFFARINGKLMRQIANILLMNVPSAGPCEE